MDRDAVNGPCSEDCSLVSVLSSQICCPSITAKSSKLGLSWILVSYVPTLWLLRLLQEKRSTFQFSALQKYEEICIIWQTGPCKVSTFVATVRNTCLHCAAHSHRRLNEVCYRNQEECHSIHLQLKSATGPMLFNASTCDDF